MNKYIKENAKYILRSYPFIQRYVRQVESLYKMDSEELKAYKEQRFLRIFRKAFQKSSFYHQLYTDAGIQIDDIQTIDDIVKLPIVTKEMIREHPEHLLTCPRWQVIAAHTSGTTGTPLTVFESWPSIWREQAYNVVYRRKCGFNQGSDRLASMRGHLDRNSISMKVNVSKTLYLSSYATNAHNIKLFVSKLKEYDPSAIEGYPSTLFNFCLLLRENGLNIHVPIIFTSSESLGIPQREFIEETLQGQLFDHYGNTERTISISERKEHDGYYEQPGYSINEYETDHIITTSLINSAFPLIRYKVEDVLTLNKGLYDKPLSPIVHHIDGRTMNYIIGKDGTRYNAAALTYLAKAIPNILIVQLVQDTVGYLKVNVIPHNKDLTETERTEAEKAINTIIGLDNMDYSLNIIRSEQLIYTKSNKLSLIVNQI